jgi:hypothetical protein
MLIAILIRSRIMKEIMLDLIKSAQSKKNLEAQVHQVHPRIPRTCEHNEK